MARRRIAKLTRKSLTGWNQLVAGAVIGFTPLIELSESYSAVDEWSKLASLLLYLLYGLPAAGVPVFGAFSSLVDKRRPRQLEATWERMLVWHALFVWLLAGASWGAWFLYRQAERISFGTLSGVWVALFIAGVGCALGLRRSFKRKVRAAQQQAPSETPS